MDDTISRAAAIDALEERLQANGYSNVALVSELNRSIGYLMRLPSADAVEVVRCKDCKHKYLERMTWTCPFGLPGGPDFFCSYGERKDGFNR